jgi:hypothetical protein
LLEREPLGPEPPPGCDPDTWRACRHVQRDYCDATGGRERALLRGEFTGLARRLREVAGPPVTLEQDLAARLGPGGPYAADPAVDAALRRRFRAWSVEHGDDYCAGRPCPPPPSLSPDDPTLRVLAADRRPRARRPVHARLGG